ncbi:Histidine phosphatase superfamily clade-2 [Penicillium argentinense]|uniref:Histidine phosphatase superfamily clade-2 n=1 Tax=Penicillium argentinense TaxID=1131581 RepID=A0A9W9KAV1_9EURO|nr:Histidine phosphatase superfamily clade-2 [Penicillium argentinense]KAJ5098372.1 Histidine phosphatase superfamily clade-2 [Penicillium argentinense]
MFSSHLFLAGLALSFQAPGLATAQQYTETVWGVFAYTTYGDSTPSVMGSQPRILTEYGASQLEAAGRVFRDRYIATGGSVNSTGSAVQELSPYYLDSRDLSILATTDQYVMASAQAFMQGLYPPLNQSGFQDVDSTANGTFYSYPLGGYQYPRIIGLGNGDPQSILVSGQTECSMHQAAVTKYRNSSEASDMTQENAAFYTGLWKEALSGAYDESQATYLNAVEIAEYLEYEILHNADAYSNVADYDIRRTRWLADQYTYATNAQTDSHSMIGMMSSVGGQTLASSILFALKMNVQSYGTQQKMTLLFGSDEPAVALASLMGLATEQQSNFYSRPVHGASLVFELFSFESDEVYPSYPGADNLFVRFFLHNGTESSTFTSYPLFGSGPSQESIPFTEFQSELETFAMQSTQEWCARCNAESIFCTGVMGESSSPKQKKQMAPALAGVIGAMVTLAVILLFGVIGFLFCLRKRADHKASIGGFKGNDKHASDTDLTFRKSIWGSASKPENGDHEDPSGGIFVRGHERLGSWEMGQQRKEVEDISSPTHENACPVPPFDDEIEEEWRMHSVLQPVKVRESI